MDAVHRDGILRHANRGSAHQAALDLGFLGAARAVPVLLLSPIAGVVADTLPRRATLIVANITMSLAALALAVLATLGRLEMTGLVLIAIVNAAAQWFDSPSRQSWVPLLVDRAYVANAIGLNSVAFNAPAVIGPAIAGLLIVSVGIAGSFYVTNYDNILQTPSARLPRAACAHVSAGQVTAQAKGVRAEGLNPHGPFKPCGYSYRLRLSPS